MFLVDNEAIEGYIVKQFVSSIHHAIVHSTVYIPVDLSHITVSRTYFAGLRTIIMIIAQVR